MIGWYRDEYPLFIPSNKVTTFKMDKGLFATENNNT